MHSRPCVFSGCSYSLYLDVHPANGSIKLVFPDLEPHELTESCSLDVADRGGATLEKVGELINVTRERVRQIEIEARDKMRSAAFRSVLRAHSETQEALGLDFEDGVSAPRGYGELDASDLAAFADLLPVQTPPGDREP